MDLNRPLPPDPYTILPAAPSFSITSTDIAHGEPLPQLHTEDGLGISPQLSWSGFPENTESFVVTCFDPDAPTPSGFWHWTVANLPATITALATDAGRADSSQLPAGAIQVRHDGGELGYLGAAPPVGDHPHRYIYVAHALNVPTLEIAAETTPTMVAFLTIHHTLARAILEATYSR